jgi:phosphoribosylglycinamide formyltransferase-1
MHSLIIFASGGGSNARAIINYFKNNGGARVALIVCNVAEAGVLDIARQEEIPYLLVDRKTIKETLLIEQLKSFNPSLLVLAGFLWMIPTGIINAFPGSIINIHPALLPGYGGKGMYGHNVHKAVLAAGERETGITIHYVNEHYDDGQVVLQAKCSVEVAEPEQLAARVLRLEHFYYPRAIEYLLKELDAVAAK